MRKTILSVAFASVSSLLSFVYISESASLTNDLGKLPNGSQWAQAEAAVQQRSMNTAAAIGAVIIAGGGIRRISRIFC